MRKPDSDNDGARTMVPGTSTTTAAGAQEAAIGSQSGPGNEVEMLQRFNSVSSTHGDGSEQRYHSVSSMQSYETQEPSSPAALPSSPDDDGGIYLLSSHTAGARLQTTHDPDASDAVGASEPAVAPFELEAVALSEADEASCNVDVQVQEFIDLVKRARSNDDLSKFKGEAEAFHEMLDAEMSALATESTARVDELHALVDELQISTRDTESLIGTKDGVGGQPTGSYRKVKDQSNDIYSLKERHAKKISEQEDRIKKTENSIAQKLQDLERRTGKAAPAAADNSGGLRRLYQKLDESLFGVRNDMNKLKDIQSAVESLHKGVYTVVKDEMCIPTIFSFLEAMLLVSMHGYSFVKHALWLSRSLRKKGLGGNVVFGFVVLGVLYFLKVALVAILDLIRSGIVACF